MLWRLSASGHLRSGCKVHKGRANVSLLLSAYKPEVITLGGLLLLEVRFHKQFNLLSQIDSQSKGSSPAAFILWIILGIWPKRTPMPLLLMFLVRCCWNRNFIRCWVTELTEAFCFRYGKSSYCQFVIYKQQHKTNETPALFRWFCCYSQLHNHCHRPIKIFSEHKSVTTTLT